MTKLKKLAQAKKKATDAFAEEFHKTVQLLPDDRFFEIVKLYVKEIITFRFHYQRSNGVEQAAQELFRKARCNEEGYSSEELIRFAKTYEAMKGRLYTPLFDVIKDKGDDAYSDLIDNLPLLGQKLFNALETKEYGNHSVVYQKIEETTRKTGLFFEFIWNGENYHGMTLREAALKHLYHSLLH